MGLVDDFKNGPGDLATFTGGDALPSPFSLLTRAVYPIKLGGLKLPSTTYISAKARKNIVITDIPGGNGTVKEQISHPDYEITMDGEYGFKNNKTALMFLDNLIAIWNRKYSIPIICPYTEKLGVKQVALQEFEAYPKKKFPSVIVYKYQAVSDNSIDLKTELKNGFVASMRKLIGL